MDDGPGLSSLVITLAADSSERAVALAALAARPELELGEPAGAWVPAVLESATPLEVFRELEALPGVTLVEVVFVSLPEATTPAHS